MATEQEGLSALAPEREEPRFAFRGQGFNSLLLWVIVIAVGVWLLLNLIRPAFVLVRSGETVVNQVDQARAIIIALVVGVVGAFIIWLITQSVRPIH